MEPVTIGGLIVLIGGIYLMITEKGKSPAKHTGQKH